MLLLSCQRSLLLLRVPLPQADVKDWMTASTNNCPTTNAVIQRVLSGQLLALRQV
jgi:hypothetical protein